VGAKGREQVGDSGWGPREHHAEDLDPTYASRYECKYIVDVVRLDEIRAFLSPFTRPDGFAVRRADRRYAVCSLYLDSSDLLLYQQTANSEKDRFKLRVRAYTDDAAKPVFFEVKRKVTNIVHKRRVGVSRERAVALLEQRPLGRLDDLSDAARADLAYFSHHVGRIAARPVLRVKYLREAYEGLGNEPARITIDTALRHAPTFGAELGHESGTWRTTPLAGAIVEIKFTERYPWWVQEFVRAFDLRQRAVPKYVLSMNHLLANGSGTALSLSGVTLPPGRI
jgi:hypothetical protein